MSDNEAKLMYAVLLCGGKWPEGVTEIGVFKASIGMTADTNLRAKQWVTESGAITPIGLEALKQYEERKMDK